MTCADFPTEECGSVGDGCGGTIDLVATYKISPVFDVIAHTRTSGPRTYDIDVYSNTSCHPSGNGEGETYLGSFTVSTNGGGSVVISETLPVSVAVGALITTTATNQATGSTSDSSN